MRTHTIQHVLDTKRANVLPTCRPFSGVTTRCIHHWLLDPSDAVCRCEGEPHYHAACRLCLITRTYPVCLETGPIAKAAMYAKRGAKAKWKKAETAEDAPEGAPLLEERTASVCKSSLRRRA